MNYTLNIIDYHIYHWKKKIKELIAPLSQTIHYHDKKIQVEIDH